jgi:hypothetical protein
MLKTFLDFVTLDLFFEIEALVNPCFFLMLVLLKCFRLQKEKVNKKDIIAPSHLIAKPSHPPNPFQPDRFLTQDFFFVTLAHLAGER